MRLGRGTLIVKDIKIEIIPMQNKNLSKEDIQRLMMLKKALLLDDIKKYQRRTAFLQKRREEKLKAGGKARVLFLCTRPGIWGSYASLYKAMMEDDAFEVFIIAMPNKKQLPGLGFGHEEYLDEGAYDFFRDFHCEVIEAYDFNSHQWLNLRSLKPDYVFYQAPYNICRPHEYSSAEVSKFSRIGYVPYGMSSLGGEVLESAMPDDFLKSCDFIFCQTEGYAQAMHELYREHPDFMRGKTIVTGEPKFDLMKEAYEDSPVWSYPRDKNKLRIIWTPRWCLSENNSHFMDYKDKFLTFCDENPDIDLVFRPHPQTFLEMLAQGHMSAEEIKTYKKEYEKRENASLDARPIYQDSFLSSDLLITDVSSIIHEYAITGKPVIYCHKSDWFIGLAAKISKTFYWAHNWSEVLEYIDQLKKGIDPLKEQRQEKIKELYTIPEEGSGQRIKTLVKNDFFKA